MGAKIVGSELQLHSIENRNFDFGHGLPCMYNYTWLFKSMLILCFSYLGPSTVLFVTNVLQNLIIIVHGLEIGE